MIGRLLRNSIMKSTKGYLKIRLGGCIFKLVKARASFGKIMEDSYYVIFYNSNFLLNFNSYLSFLIPFIVYSKYISKLTKITFDISLIYFIIICLCFFYTVVYIINDWKDY